MNKLRRIWRACCAGFWAAWREVPPKKASDLSMSVSCDTTEVEASLDRVISKLDQIKQRESDGLLMATLATPKRRSATSPKTRGKQT